MKTIVIALLLLPFVALAQSHDRNYIKSTTYKSADTTDANSKSVQIVYFDGLGRPIQQIAHRQSASGKDIVTHIGYDAFGRQEKDYLPYAASTASLNYYPSAESETLSFYGSPNFGQTGNPNFEATANPYSQKLFEASPLNRVLQQAAPGDPWKLGGGHEVRMEYQTNAASEARLYKADSQLSAATGLYMPTISQNGHYGAGQLYKTVTRDENWTSGNAHTVQEFKDKEGRVVLKRAYGESIINGREEDSWHDTYYVYDQYGNLSFVMPPLSAF